jgi:hypothetical protein
MTYSPQTLRSLMAFWQNMGGVNLGIVGDVAHQAKGRSYHLGRSDLTWDAYSRITARDKAGLTEAASAVDLGRVNGSLRELRAFSQSFYRMCQTNFPGTRDVREVIWSPDGIDVLRWDRERGYASPARIGEADNSHLTHTHISFYRDSEYRPKVFLFQAVFSNTIELPDTSTEEEKDMTVAARALTTTKSGIVRVKRDLQVIPTEGGIRYDISAGAVRHGIGPYALTALDDRLHYLITEDGVPCYISADPDDVSFEVNDGANVAESGTYPVIVGGKTVGSVILP